MCQKASGRKVNRLAGVALALLAVAGTAAAQSPLRSAGELRPDWRRIGSSTFDFFLASAATGPVNRVWFSETGDRLFVRTGSGHFFESTDAGDWKPAGALAAPEVNDWLSRTVKSLPETGAAVRSADVFYARLYAFGANVYRSDDGGLNWINLTSFRGQSVIGGGNTDLAVSPMAPDVLVVANQFGVWRSSDAGLSWIGLNETLPNLPVRKLVGVPAGTQGARIALPYGYAFEWAPGEKESWQPVEDSSPALQDTAQQAVSAQLGATVTALSRGSRYSYAGAADGRIWTSLDQGNTWQLARLGDGGSVLAVFAVPDNPVTVFVAFAESAGGVARRVLRSGDGGLTWEDLTGDLPAGAVNGLATDPAGTALYAATSRGVFLSLLETRTVAWVAMTGALPPAPVVNVRLDEAGNQIYAAVEGFGVYAAPAPHRFWRVEVVNSADYSSRPVAPGSLLTVLGGRLVRAQAGLLDVPVLHATDAESQIQIPFEISGSSAQLALELVRGRITLSVPLLEVSPAIFVDRDGSALLLDAESGLLLDAQNPARRGARVQVLATGLGKVAPAWTTGAAAPLNETPKVVAAVQAHLDQSPVEVTRATLAPGYVGFYLIEVQLPAVLNGGPAEFYLEAGGRQSNHVRVDVAP